MENNIKNFIEEGEKEFDEKFKFFTYKGVSKPSLFSQTIVYEPIKQFISSRQISLIKMIMEMVESEKKERTRQTASESACDKCGFNNDHRQCFCQRNQVLDTISSKLSSLVNGEK